MAGSQPATAPSTILWADHEDKTAAEESQPVCMRRRKTQTSTSCLSDSLRFLPPFSLQKLSWLSRILRGISGHKSSILPDCLLFWLKHLPFLLALASRLSAFEQRAAKPEFGNVCVSFSFNVGRKQCFLFKSGHLWAGRR